MEPKDPDHNTENTVFKELVSRLTVQGEVEIVQFCECLGRPEVGLGSGVAAVTQEAAKGTLIEE